MSDPPLPDAAQAAEAPTPTAERKGHSAPSPWRNSFFWFAGILFLVGIWGLVSGESAIRDPGQVRESGLVWIYLGGGVVMVLNGWMTHLSALQHFREASEDED